MPTWQQDPTYPDAGWSNFTHNCRVLTIIVMLFASFSKEYYKPVNRADIINLPQVD